MSIARFMDRPEDLQALGLIPGVVQQREDGRIQVQGTPGSEVWYFDAIFDDGTKVVAGFRNKPMENCESPVDDPTVVINITTPDGKMYADTHRYSPEESSMALDHCEVKFGPHTLKGDLTDYDFSLKPISHNEDAGMGTDGLNRTAVKGIGFDLHYHALVKPFRHGAGRTQFDEEGKLYSTWFCVPRMKVEGTLYIEGEEKKVSGYGYHDHRCMAINDAKAWDHWLWGRHNLDEYTVVIYELRTSENFGYVSIPLFAIYDKEGNLLVDGDDTLKCEMLETMWEEKTQRNYPLVRKYSITQSGRSFEYTVNGKELIELRDMYGASPEQLRAVYDQLKLRPCYTRFSAEGVLKITENGETKTVSGPMIYEVPFLGAPDETKVF